MALSALQALYDDDDNESDVEIPTKTAQQELVEDQIAVINDPSFSIMSKIKLNLTPAIAVRPEDTSSFLDIKAREVTFNPKYEDMYAPAFGPVNPNLTQQQRSFRNVLNGHAESTTLSDFQFENQRRTFDSFGYALDPSVGEHATPQIVGDTITAEKNQGMTIFEAPKKRLTDKRKKEKNYDSSDVEGFQGPWAPFADEITVSRPSEVCSTLIYLFIIERFRFFFRKNKKKSMNISRKDAKPNVRQAKIQMPTQPPIPARQLSTKSPKIRHRQLFTFPIRTITKADRFFTYRKTSASIFVRNTHHNVVSFRNNAFMFTKVIRKPYRKFTIFLYRLICFLRVRWTAKSNCGNFIMNVGAFERTLGIVKLYEMLILIMLERSFFQHRTIKWSNSGIRRQVGVDCFHRIFIRSNLI